MFLSESFGKKRKKMSIGITQLILILVIGIIFFGNIPKLFKDVGTGIVAFKNTLETKSKENLVDSEEKASLPTTTPLEKPKEENRKS